MVAPNGHADTDTDMCMPMHIDTCTDMRIDVCIDMRIDMHMNLFFRMPRPKDVVTCKRSDRCVCRQAGIHICTHMSMAHVYTCLWRPALMCII